MIPGADEYDIDITFDEADVDRLLAVTPADASPADALTYAKNVFVPLTTACRYTCTYCTYFDAPGEASLLSREEVREILRTGADAGCTEALFTFGDEPGRAVHADSRAVGRLGPRFDSFVSPRGVRNGAGRGPASPLESGRPDARADGARRGREREHGRDAGDDGGRGRPRGAAPEESGAAPRHDSERRANSTCPSPPVCWSVSARTGATGPKASSPSANCTNGTTTYRRSSSRTSSRTSAPVRTTVGRDDAPGRGDGAGGAPERDFGAGAAEPLADAGVAGLRRGRFGRRLPVTDDYINPDYAWPALRELEDIAESAGVPLHERLPVYDRFVDNGRIPDRIRAALDAGDSAGERYRSVVERT